MSNTNNRKRNKSERYRSRGSNKNLYALLLIVLILVCGYLYVSDMDGNNTAYIQDEVVNKEGYYFSENTDSTRFIAKIITDRNFNIIELSKTFYKSDIFWPYIFEANPSLENENPLNIEKGAIIYIPRVKPSLLDANDEENRIRVKALGDSILTVISDKQKKQSEVSFYRD